MKKSLAEQLEEKLGTQKTYRPLAPKHHHKETLPVTDDNIKLGSIINLPMNTQDSGFVVKYGKEIAHKRNVIVGFSDDCWAVATILINTKSDNKTDALSDCQFPLNERDYTGVLDYDSTLNCAKIFEIPKNRLKQYGGYMGKLTPKDLDCVIQTLERTIVIAPKEKKKYGITDRSKEK